MEFAFHEAPLLMSASSVLHCFRHDLLQANAPAEVCKGSASSASSESGLLEKRRDSLDAKLEAILEIGEVYHSESILPSEPTKMCNVQLEDKDWGACLHMLHCSLQPKKH